MGERSRHTGSSEGRSAWISPGWLVLGALILGVVVFAAVIGHLLTDRLTIHNRTRAPITFTAESFDGYSNYVPACSSTEFEWEQGNGGNSGWIPTDGLRRWQGGAVHVEIPVERWFEVQMPADHFTVVVTGDGLTEVQPGSSLPPCEGMPAPASVADYIDAARLSLEQHFEGSGRPIFSFQSARCRADGGAVLLFEQHGSDGAHGTAFALSGRPSSDPGAWAGGFASVDPASDPEIAAFFSDGMELSCP